MLVDALAAGFEPSKCHDRYRENLRALIDAKIRCEEVVEGAAAPTLAPVIDILETLKASRAKAKKPMAASGALTAMAAGDNDAVSRRGRKRA